MQTDDGVHSASVVAVWEGGWRCRVSAAGFDLIVDEPPEAGGTGTGPMPTEYLLAALASCYALALSWAAGKRGVSLPDLAVTATGVYDGPRFGALQFLVATSAPADVVSPLIQPALRVCYVSNTIASSPPIEVVIAGEPGTPRKPGTPGTGVAAGRGDAAGAGDGVGAAGDQAPPA
jgi:putative redox protein